MKVIKKQLVSALTLLLIVGLVSSCDKDFEEVNSNPNSPETVSSSLLLPNIIRNAANEIVGKGWGIGNVVMQYTSKIQFTNEDRYNWGPEGDPYSVFYNTLRDVNNMVLISGEAGENNYVGVALVMKSLMYAFMTDAYGDLPYTEAIGAKDGINYPKFDRQDIIYDGILRDLEQANQLLGSSSEGLEGDILFQGDILKWKKLANSLRLRALMRISDRENPSSGMQAIVSNPQQFPVFEGNEDNAALQYLQDVPNQHYLFTTRSGSFDEYRLSTTIEGYLKDMEDPRLFAYYQPTNDSGAGIIGAPEDYAGVPNGLADENAYGYSPSGDPNKGGSNFISRVGLLFSCLACSEYASPVGFQTVLMSYSELQFLLAEARERGFISVGDAGTYYENGIQASFDYYEDRLRVANLGEIADAVQPAPAYYSQGTVAYTGSQEEKLEKIGTQKWIALFFNGLEGWFDWRRTGIPEIEPGPAAYIETVPVRFMYPTGVQALNKENYEQAVSVQGQDRITTRVWWDVE
ncbi:SusD/RagB family nutrient-binding outer membrane lipoprotein [Cyclobacterium jeungdonense]|uniref:SusD/RagB family nutrient-binding outer membrane lipoprotein n=1 Tax=Cyclobacterium jeungdonense TaxID=708087 RepID=A0ABT8CB06_9BACT|nr:SusD/RagB family nutrient-binding outer membrane lipoprotein [Cyclobacterium jeungdonense]MDN3689989.1 SusD/RagB family nutrient-binding outer membrane lipoprotein [Cyclobacterium jeungdonense]